MNAERAALELLRRTEAAESLIAFTEYTFPRYRTANHHRIIAGQLERVERGEIDRLMLLVPPRHGKSELASIRLPAWYLGRQPHKQFLSVSATDQLASDFGRSVRNTIDSPEYRAIFDTALAEDSQAKGKWHTKAGGIYYALGIGGSVLGRGGDVILVDDPFGSMKEAQSELERKNVWDWYTGTAYNRLMPGGAIVVINHRMHEDDLCGRLLAQQAAGGDQWTVVELPALSERNEALWPDAYPVKALERIRDNTLPRYWSALYQQNPTPEDGEFFKSEWLVPYDKRPAIDTMRIYGASDYAVTSEGGDYTVHVVVGLDPEGRPWLLDLWRGQTDSATWIDAWCDLVLEWHPMEWGEERGQILAAVGPFIERRARERQVFCYRRQIPSKHDKAIRAQSIRAMMAMRGLCVPHRAPWYPALRSELLAFPAGKHDDQVDALSLVGQLMDTAFNGALAEADDDDYRGQPGRSAVTGY
jgi:predicted phage terminase large subunit-like protein